MTKTKTPVFYLLLFSALALFLILLMQPWQIFQFYPYISVLFPKGFIAFEERDLLLIIQGLMLLVIFPVYILTFIFSWKYRADRPAHTAKYDPDLVDSKLAEYIWWSFPTVMTLIVSYLTWTKTHQLDPFKPLESNKAPITIQAVALQWKWLFIYPEEQIASVNFLQIPTNTPIRFEVTADAPMNSLWIPALGGQIYAMPKMRTLLNLIANQPGDFRGSSANISGTGFADMHFITRATGEEEYRQWLESTKQSGQQLDWATYKQLATPSQNLPVQLYRLQVQNLFDRILMKYMHPQKNE